MFLIRTNLVIEEWDMPMNLKVAWVGLSPQCYGLVSIIEDNMSHTVNMMHLIDYFIEQNCMAFNELLLRIICYHGDAIALDCFLQNFERQADEDMRYYITRDRPEFFLEVVNMLQTKLQCKLQGTMPSTQSLFKQYFPCIKLLMTKPILREYLTKFNHVNPDYFHAAFDIALFTANTDALNALQDLAPHSFKQTIFNYPDLSFLLYLMIRKNKCDYIMYQSVMDILLPQELFNLLIRKNDPHDLHFLLVISAMYRKVGYLQVLSQNKELMQYDTKFFPMELFCYIKINNLDIKDFALAFKMLINDKTTLVQDVNGYTIVEYLLLNPNSRNNPVVADIIRHCIHVPNFFKKLDELCSFANPFCTEPVCRVNVDFARFQPFRFQKLHICANDYYFAGHPYEKDSYGDDIFQNELFQDTPSRDLVQNILQMDFN